GLASTLGSFLGKFAKGGAQAFLQPK
uniref:Antimicrobial peptide 3 n=1 Tax=Xenopus tropicalis TaxID=8364 RepID=XT3_XENTR|nr:RecName: Full=Antimicrobial peptide 3; AltName: Full=Levitide-like peptide; AltName: Full=XT-3 [Xenopus tropicalis]